MKQFLFKSIYLLKTKKNILFMNVHFNFVYVTNLQLLYVLSYV